ncbi:MAG TPA: TraR/DksA C4-type zinc finger protein [Planctomycetota bacterium]|nr:TraR/DksA C4-type zinc finger protein [Planctomycetota bacterium]
MSTENSVSTRGSRSPYPAQELSQFKKNLLERQTNLLRSCSGLCHVALRKAGTRSDDDAQVTDDPADLAAEVCEQNISIQMLGRLQAELEEIRGALERIEDCSYGSCEQCGKPIPQARLDAIPTADTCIPCKSAQEGA